MGERRADATCLRKVFRDFRVLGFHVGSEKADALCSPARTGGREPVRRLDEKMNSDESDLESIKFGSVEFQYPTDEPESPAGDRAADAIKVAEWMAKLIWSGRTERVRMIYASVAIALLRNDLNLQEIAAHFSVTQRRAEQIVAKVKTFRISERPHH